MMVIKIGLKIYFKTFKKYWVVFRNIFFDYKIIMFFIYNKY